MKIIFYSFMMLTSALVLATCIFGKSGSDVLNNISDGYCTKVAASQFSLWTEVRVKLRQSDNPLTHLNDSDNKIVKKIPKLKSLAENVAKFQEIIMTTPIVNAQADAEFARVFEKLAGLIGAPERNKSEISRVKYDFVSALKDYAPAFMSACHNHVSEVTKECQEEFAIGSDKFNACADPKLKETAEQALELVPGFKVITAANSSLKETMNEVGSALDK
jgi:hypothetical protein